MANFNHDVVESLELQESLRLTPWPVVRDAWNAISGENLCRARVWQIGKRAEAKLRVALADLADDVEGRQVTLAHEGVRKKPSGWQYWRDRRAPS